MSYRTEGENFHPSVSISFIPFSARSSPPAESAVDGSVARGGHFRGTASGADSDASRPIQRQKVFVQRQPTANGGAQARSK